MMGKYFDDAHALWGSQLLEQPVEVTDSEDIAAARKKASDYESCMVLGKALSRQLRYREASEAFGRALEFRPDDPDALLTGVETRSSSPVKLVRDEHYEANIRGVYPCGEGAGYAGGILSAAADGMRCAEKLLEVYTT